jgi:hypothetical protein
LDEIALIADGILVGRAGGRHAAISALIHCTVPVPTPKRGGDLVHAGVAWI